MVFKPEFYTRRINISLSSQFIQKKNQCSSKIYSLSSSDLDSQDNHLVTTKTDIPGEGWLDHHPKILSISHLFLSSFIFFNKIVLSFLTNPYNNYYSATSKEYIALDKTAKQDFWLEIWFDSLPGNVDSFAAELDKYSKQYCYGFLFNIPTVCQADPSNVNNITYIDPMHMLETWHKINDDLIARNANEVWGMRDWTTPPPKIEKTSCGNYKLWQNRSCQHSDSHQLEEVFGMMEVNHTLPSNHTIAHSWSSNWN